MRGGKHGPVGLAAHDDANSGRRGHVWSAPAKGHHIYIEPAGKSHLPAFTENFGRISSVNRPLKHGVHSVTRFKEIIHVRYVW